jgi:2'-5' RNA ligase
MGNTTAVLVALPSVMDPIRLVGDEDKHATLLFFGETATLPDDAKTVLLNAVGQAAKLIMPFSEGITDVARLGSENPPALVAMLTNNTLGMIRDVLQINPRLVEFLSNGTQHPGYTPHVTLAYPDYSNEAKLRDLVKKLYPVKFDRLALWWGDEQIEFSLGSSTYNDTEMSMSDNLEEFLAHHGIKGQRWGVRRSSSEIQRATITKPDGEQTLAVVNNKTKTAMEVHGDKKGTIATEYRLTKYGTDVVSNKELDSYMKRVDLEKKYATYATSKQASNKGVKKFIGEVISNAAKNEVAQLSQGKQGPIMKQVKTAMAAKSGGKHAKK